MRHMRCRGLAALVVIVALIACKKEGGDDSGLPAALRPQPARGDSSKLVMPPVMAHVPADTPYLIASVDALPGELVARMQQALAPMAGMVARGWNKARSESRLLDAILAELDGKWSRAGIESLGLSAEPRFAIYGLGLQPVVARIAIKDHRVLQATIERVAAKAGEALPAMETRDGRGYWKIVKDEASFVIALADHELIAAAGKPADVDARLGLILGVDKPAQSMADGAEVKQLMARHGFGGQAIAFADTRRITSKALDIAGVTPSPACKGAIDRLTAVMPRVVFGYGELSASKVSGGLVFELAPEAVAALRAIKAEFPGLSQALAGRPMFAAVVGADVAKAQQLGGAAAGGIQQFGAACELGTLVDGAERVARGLSQPLPAPFAAIVGAAMVVDQLTFAAGTQRPENVEGVVLVASRDAHALFDQAGALAPPVKSFGITADGKLHDVSAEGLPFAVAAGVGERLIVLTTGAQRRASAEKLLAAKTGVQAPLFALIYRVDKLVDLALRSGEMTQNPEAAELTAFMQQMPNLFTGLSVTIDVTDHGLAYWSTAELK